MDAGGAPGRLDKAGLKEGEDFDSSVYFLAGYDSPFRLLNRHNAVCGVNGCAPFMRYGGWWGGQCGHTPPIQ